MRMPRPVDATLHGVVDYSAGALLTTVFPRQGHYARDPLVATHPPPDVTIERIGDLLDHDLGALVR